MHECCGGWIFITSGLRHVSTISPKTKPWKKQQVRRRNQEIHEIAVYTKSMEVMQPPQCSIVSLIAPRSLLFLRSNCARRARASSAFEDDQSPKRFWDYIRTLWYRDICYDENKECDWRSSSIKGYVKLFEKRILNINMRDQKARTFGKGHSVGFRIQISIFSAANNFYWFKIQVVIVYEFIWFLDDKNKVWPVIINEKMIWENTRTYYAVNLDRRHGDQRRKQNRTRIYN